MCHVKVWYLAKAHRFGYMCHTALRHVWPSLYTDALSGIRARSKVSANVASTLGSINNSYFTESRSNPLCKKDWK